MKKSAFYISLVIPILLLLGCSIKQAEINRNIDASSVVAFVVLQHNMYDDEQWNLKEMISASSIEPRSISMKAKVNPVLTISVSSEYQNGFNVLKLSSGYFDSSGATFTQDDFNNLMKNKTFRSYVHMISLDSSKETTERINRDIFLNYLYQMAKKGEGLEDDKIVVSQNIINEILKDNFKKIPTSQSPFKIVQMIHNLLLDKFIEEKESRFPPIEQKPVLPEPEKLVKNKFKKTEEFQEQVKRAQARYLEDVEKIIADYNERVKKRNEIISTIKEEIEDEIDEFKMNVYKVAIPIVLGNPIAGKMPYDADKEIMSLEILVENSPNYKKYVEIEIEPEEAQMMEMHKDKIRPNIEYKIEQDSLVIDKIRIIYDNSIFTSKMLEKLASNETDATFTISTLKEIDRLLEKNIGSVTQVSKSVLNIKEEYAFDQLVANIPQATENKKKWIFAIAVENYDETDPVTYSKRSADLFVRALQRRFGVQDENTVKLIDSEATSGKIKTRIKDILKQIKDGDTVYFYYSGHGVPGMSGDAYILPSDYAVEYIDEDKFFQLDNIYQLFSNSKADNVVAFIDSCFSGKTDNKLLFKDVAPGLIRTKQMTFDEKRFTVMTAGTNSQFSNSFKEKENRLFSHYLIDALIKNKTNIKQIYGYVNDKVIEQSQKIGPRFLQEPQIYGNINLSL